MVRLFLTNAGWKSETTVSGEDVKNRTRCIEGIILSSDESLSSNLLSMKVIESSTESLAFLTLSLFIDYRLSINITVTILDNNRINYTMSENSFKPMENGTSPFWNFSLCWSTWAFLFKKISFLNSSSWGDE